MSSNQKSAAQRVNPQCLACGSTGVSLQTYDDVLTHKGITVEVEDLQRSVCGKCGYEWTDHAQHDHNLQFVRAAYRNRIEAQRTEDGLLTGAQIREIRERLALTQRDAADLFGGGANAFSKYENQEIIQSKAMDVLLRVASRVGVKEIRDCLAASGTPVGVRGHVSAVTQIDVNVCRVLAGNVSARIHELAARILEMSADPLVSYRDASSASTGARVSVATLEAGGDWIQNPLTQAMVSKTKSTKHAR